MRAARELLLACRACGHGLRQDGVQVVDVKVDMNRGPVPPIPPDIVAAFGGLGSGLLLDQPDGGIPTAEQDVGGHGPGHLGQAQSVALEPVPVLEQWFVDRDRVLHSPSLKKTKKKKKQKKKKKKKKHKNNKKTANVALALSLGRPCFG